MGRFRLTGQELCELKMQDFCQRSSEFIGDIVYAYLARFKEGEPQVVVWGEGRVQS